MAAYAKRVEVLTIKLEAKAGALAAVYGAFREAKVDILASWAYQMGPSEAQAHFYARDVERAREVLTNLGKGAKTEQACYVSGDDRIGAYHDHLKKIADAGVNVEATDAFAVDGKFGMVFFARPEDIARLYAALGC